MVNHQYCRISYEYPISHRFDRTIIILLFLILRPSHGVSGKKAQFWGRSTPVGTHSLALSVTWPVQLWHSLTALSNRIECIIQKQGLIVVPKLNMDFPACFRTWFLTSGRVVMDHLLISSCNFIIVFNWSCWCFIIFRESCFLIFKQTGKIFFKCIHISKIYCNISNWKNLANIAM